VRLSVCTSDCRAVRRLDVEAPPLEGGVSRLRLALRLWRHGDSPLGFEEHRAGEISGRILPLICGTFAVDFRTH